MIIRADIRRPKHKTTTTYHGSLAAARAYCRRRTVEDCTITTWKITVADDEGNLYTYTQPEYERNEQEKQDD